MIKLILATFLLLTGLCSGNAHANAGFESEVLTFLNKGYHASVWYGYFGKRLRLVYSRLAYRWAFTPAGFSDFAAKFKEVEFDFIVGEQRTEFRGLWFALGGGRTDLSITSQTTGATAVVTSNDLHTGIGYAIPLKEVSMPIRGSVQTSI